MHNSNKMYCKHGHELTTENTYVRLDGSRECRECRKRSKRNGDLRRRYGITNVEYARLLAVQGACCGICWKQHYTEGLVVDHDHKTGKVRGLLCPRCNYGLGKFQDSYDIIQNAGVYLAKAEGCFTVPYQDQLRDLF